MIDINLHYADGTVIERVNQGWWQVINGPILHPDTKQRPVAFHVRRLPELNRDELNRFHQTLIRRCDPRYEREVTYE